MDRPRACFAGWQKASHLEESRNSAKGLASSRSRLTSWGCAVAPTAQELFSIDFWRPPKQSGEDNTDNTQNLRATISPIVGSARRTKPSGGEGPSRANLCRTPQARRAQDRGGISEALPRSKTQ